MLTYEDMTGFFLKAATSLGLVTHPEFWQNTRSLEREFACTCHTGRCEDVEQQSSCVVSFTWGALDTALSLEGPEGICEFFHDESDPQCLHLHTHAVPPLILDLSYAQALHGTALSDEMLLSLSEMLKLQASEYSRSTVETSPGVSMVLHEHRLRPEVLTLQQRVEIPIWHPLGMHGLHDESLSLGARLTTRGEDQSVERLERAVATPHPEEWLPQVMVEICQDILRVLATLDRIVSYHASDR